MLSIPSCPVDILFFKDNKSNGRKKRKDLLYEEPFKPDFIYQMLAKVNPQLSVTVSNYTCTTVHDTICTCTTVHDTTCTTVHGHYMYYCT